MAVKGAKVTMTLASVLTEVTSAVTGFVPDLSVYVASGLVVGLTAMFVRRLIKAAR